ncbi:hypothetical protein AJ80_02563 [Polytolypa hystricis UAMH7299]|uniref:DUF8021 domain-containing protein n=1 Tax=Polytolypa hystricis (strain UAMH7299) TaxID=1447883 RepID=A0A2B7YQH3_POLH7|nr:hypothetical protein AJ80_02563 [Polytolypa hystricis UAMH7299]
MYKSTVLSLSLAAAAATLFSPALAQSRFCPRQALEEVTREYILSQTAGSLDPISYFLSYTPAYTENFKSMPIEEGLVATTPLKIDYHRSLYDIFECATYTEIIVTDPSHPYVIGTQLRLFPTPDDGLYIGNFDSIITDEGDWLFDAEGTLQYASQEAWTEIPKSERDSREAIQAAGDAYLDLFKDDSVEVPWGAPCNRLEGGNYTGSGLLSDSCNVDIPCCHELVNRKYIIDEVLGAVSVFLEFGGEGGSPDSHEFRLEGGKLRYIHTLTVTE